MSKNKPFFPFPSPASQVGIEGLEAQAAAETKGLTKAEAKGLSCEGKGQSQGQEWQGWS